MKLRCNIINSVHQLIRNGHRFKVVARIAEENRQSGLIICEGNLVAFVETMRSGTTDRIAEINNMVAVVKNA